MSRNDWERGTLKIPAAAWKPLRDALCKTFNDKQDRMLALLLRVHVLMLEYKKTCKRGTFDVGTAWSALEQSHRALFDELRKLDESFYFYPVLCKRKDDGTYDRKTLLQPKMKDLPHAVSTKTTEYGAGDGGIYLDHKEHTLTWSVSENNHAVEHARASVMGRKLFELLGKIAWTRGSGGEIVGNDEYNRDNSESGGGANYTTACYRYRSPKEKEEAARARRQSYGMNVNVHNHYYGRRF